MRDIIELLQHVVCHTVLSNDALRPTRLKRHLMTAYSAVENKPKEFFIVNKTSLNMKNLNISGGFHQQNKNNAKSSYDSALLIGKQKKSHTIFESLEKASIRTVVQIILGHESQ